MLFFFVAAVTKAQERKISGMLTDRDTHEAVIQTTVQITKIGRASCRERV